MPYANPLQNVWNQQKQGAKRRGVEFFLTFDAWLKIWQDSGHLAHRGCRRGQYVMSRPKDKGPYQVGNVRIVKAEDNNREARVIGQPGRRLSASTRAKISVKLKASWAQGRERPSAATKKKMSKAHLRRWAELGAAGYGR